MYEPSFDKYLIIGRSIIGKLHLMNATLVSSELDIFDASYLIKEKD